MRLMGKYSQSVIQLCTLLAVAACNGDVAAPGFSAAGEISRLSAGAEVTLSVSGTLSIEDSDGRVVLQRVLPMEQVSDLAKFARTNLQDITVADAVDTLLGASPDLPAHGSENVVHREVLRSLFTEPSVLENDPRRVLRKSIDSLRRKDDTLGLIAEGAGGSNCSLDDLCSGAAVRHHR